MSAKDVADIVIITRSGAVAVKSFNVLTIIGSTKAGVPTWKRWKKYSTLEELKRDGYNETSAEYLMASALKMSEPAPSFFAVGQTKTGDSSITDSLAKIKNEAEAFYALCATTRDLATQKLISDFAEDKDNMCLYLVAEELKMFTEGATAPVDSLAKYVNDNGRTRTAVLYHHEANSKYIDGGFAGVVLRKIGNYTVKFKEIGGFPASTLTTSQQTEVVSLNCNVFLDKGGNGTFKMILEGTCGKGFIDEVVSGDYLTSRIQESMLSMFKKNDIVSYDNDGIMLVENAIAKILNNGIQIGIITAHAVNEDGVRTGGYVIYSPKAEDIPSEVKELRKFDNLTAFDYFKKVGIHSVKITGYAFY